MSHLVPTNCISFTFTAKARAAVKKKKDQSAQKPNSIISQGMTWNFSIACTKYITWTQNNNQPLYKEIGWRLRIECDSDINRELRLIVRSLMKEV